MYDRRVKLTCYLLHFSPEHWRYVSFLELRSDLSQGSVSKVSVNRDKNLDRYVYRSIEIEYNFIS